MTSGRCLTRSSTSTAPAASGTCSRTTCPPRAPSTATSPDGGTTASGSGSWTRWGGRSGRPTAGSRPRAREHRQLDGQGDRTRGRAGVRRGEEVERPEALHRRGHAGSAAGRGSRGGGALVPLHSPGRRVRPLLNLPRLGNQRLGLGRRYAYRPRITYVNVEAFVSPFASATRGGRLTVDCAARTRAVWGLRWSSASPACWPSGRDAEGKRGREDSLFGFEGRPMLQKQERDLTDTEGQSCE